MKPPRRQRGGAAILILLAVLALGGTYYLISSVNAMSTQRKAFDQAQNAAVLSRAKLALIGYVVARASKGGVTDPEPNPGALPCPEHPWHIGLAAEEGTAGPAVGIPNPGYGTANCSSIGRFPWKTIGTEKLLDASGEPLWYVVGPAWRKTSTSTQTNINSNTAGDLAADGQQVVALIIAPGPAMSTQAGTTPAGVGCTARNQARSAPAGSTLDPLDYLECYNAGTLQFTTAAAAGSFNDQVAVVTAADLLPGIEGAIANRIEREIAPALKSVYASNTWGATVSAANPVFPYPAAFANPTTSAYQGSSALSAGLLPFFQTQGCNSATDPRCTTATTGGSAFLVFSKNAADVQAGGTGTIRTQSSCAWAAQIYVCTGEYLAPSLKVTFQLRVTNIAMGLRTFDASKITCTAVDDAGGGIPLQNIGCQSTGVALQSDGSALVTVTTNLTPDIVASGWGTYAQYTINFDRAVFGDHALLDSTDTTTGWFVRNEWYRLLYYVVASGYTAAALPSTPACTDGATCLVARNPTGKLTALNGGIAGTGAALVVSSSTGAPATPFRIQVDSEVMRVTAVSGTTWTVVRGTEGSSAGSHNDQSNVKLVGRDRALLILAGRSINGSSRPNSLLANYLEYGNRTGNYERRAVTNAVSATEYSDTGGGNAYAISAATIAVGQPVQFRAASSNTGAATLTSPATGTRNILNTDLSPLTASQIQANALVNVIFDGTQFLLSMLPFNDRLVVVQSN